jgi:hypothetical protein
MVAVAIPLLIKYGIPAATYGIGHLIGFFHGKHKVKQQLGISPNTKS